MPNPDSEIANGILAAVLRALGRQEFAIGIRERCWRERVLVVGESGQD
jgi:hypothetical protein